MALSLAQLRSIYRTAYMRVYRENIPAPSFLKSFFPVRTYNSATVQLEVQRGDEKIAVDVMRGTRGNRNQFSVWTGKEYLPPYYNENFDATSLDHYDRVLGALSDSSATAQASLLARNVGDKYLELRKKIERRKELQCSQAFETGIVTMQNGDDIDFKRKATSLVDLGGAGGYWSVTTTDVEAQLIAGCEFVRNEGKNGMPTFNLVMSGTAWVAFKKTDYFTTNANFEQVRLIDINMPQKDAFGAGYMGQISAGAYIINIWTYDEIYKNSSNVITRYWPENKAVLLPTAGTRFELAHGAVPSVMKLGGRETIGNVAGEYISYDILDKNHMAHYYHLVSAPVAIPVSVDMIYTVQCLA